MTDDPRPPAAVLFDRDNTLVVDVPYNGDPAKVRAMPTAIETVRALRSAGVVMGVVSNQSGIARGILTRDQVDAVNGTVDALFGGFDVWRICPHGDGDGCVCRKPAPGMLLEAMSTLGVDPDQVVMIGDIGADMGAAAAAGVRGVLVPTPITRAEEIASAGIVAPDLASAVCSLFPGIRIELDRRATPGAA